MTGSETDQDDAVVSLTPEGIAADPECLTRILDTPAGRLVLRLLRPTDAGLLGRYLEGLSLATRQLWAPHAFDRDTAARLCAELVVARSLRFVGEMSRQDEPELVAYFIVALEGRPSELQRYSDRGQHLQPSLTCLLAPSVADCYQSQGLGSLIMPPLLETARSLGRRYMVLMGGVQARNLRAIRFYEKFGFRRMGDFVVRDLDNHDMMLDLA
ncbi:MAG: GNAT family N-acetyltransferase [Candidatus Latescibacterota bacterium]